MNGKIFVVIKDGNRTVAWDYYGDTSIRKILGNRFFAWEPNTVRVNGTPLKDDELDTRLDAFSKDGAKVKITMKRLKLKEVLADG